MLRGIARICNTATEAKARLHKCCIASNTALALAGHIAAKSPLALAGTKLAVNYAIDHPTGEALQQIALLQSAIFDIGEMTTAIKAWQAKSDAEFAPLAAVPRL